MVPQLPGRFFTSATALSTSLSYSRSPGSSQYRSPIGSAAASSWAKKPSSLVMAPARLLPNMVHTAPVSVAMSTRWVALASRMA